MCDLHYDDINEWAEVIRLELDTRAGRPDRQRPHDDDWDFMSLFPDSKHRPRALVGRGRRSISPHSGRKRIWIDPDIEDQGALEV